MLRQHLSDSESSPFAARQCQHVARRQVRQTDRRQRCTCDMRKSAADSQLKSADVRVPADQCRIEYRGRKDIVDMLWQQRQLQGNFLPRCGGHVLAV